MKSNKTKTSKVTANATVQTDGKNHPPVSTVDVLGKSVSISPFVHNENLFGLTNALDLSLQYNADQHIDQLRDTILHELTHHVSYQLHLHLNERQVHALTAGLLQTLRANPELTQWLLLE